MCLLFQNKPHIYSVFIMFTIHVMVDVMLFKLLEGIITFCSL